MEFSYTLAKSWLPLENSIPREICNDQEIKSLVLIVWFKLIASESFANLDACCGSGKGATFSKVEFIGITSKVKFVNIYIQTIFV